ncbi:ligand-binding sensor domain-containing diguanylate cyclase [Duganella radicis]|nr:ligand-binding sensor domain-containing diguanylate cyclase [Duganella radicis]
MVIEGICSDAAHKWWGGRSAAWFLHVQLLFLALAFIWPAYGQQIPPRQFGQHEGLGNMGVTSLVQDGDGYLWAGTENGLYRYDGERFHRFRTGVPGSVVAALHADQAGQIWVGTTEGLCRIVRHACRQVLTREGRALPMALGQHLAVFGPDQMVVVSGERLWRLTARPAADTWEARPFFDNQAGAPPPAIDALLAGGAGELWMGCGARICHYHHGRVEEYGVAHGLPEAPLAWSVMLLDQRGELWCRSRGGHLLSLPAGGARFVERRPAAIRLEALLDPVLAQDRDGRLLVSNNFGLTRGGPGRWETLGSKQGLAADDEISALLVDREGDLWIGIAGRGLRHWQGYRRWENWTERQGLPSATVWSFLRDRDGTLLVGTGRGLAAMPAHAAGFVTHARSAAVGDVQLGNLAMDHAGGLWAGSFAGALQRRRPGGARFEQVAKLPRILALLVDRSGQLWICCDGGLYVIADPEHDPRPRRVPLDVAGTGGGVVRTACQTAQGALWFLVNREVLRLYDGRWTTVRHGLPGDVRLSFMTCAEQTLWLAAQGEAAVWQARADADVARLSPLAMAMGPLKGQPLSGMLIDRRHWLWLGTDSGVGVWNGSAWRLLNQDSGLVWNDTNQGALYEDQDGSVWIGTANGASHLLHPQSLFEQQPLRLLLDRVSLDGVTLPAARFSVPWTPGALEVRLAALSFHNHDALRYHYRLDGLEQRWNTTEVPQLRYAALPPGKYELQMVAENGATGMRSALVTLPFTLAPPWWRTVWFYLAMAVLALALLALAWRWRLNKALRRALELEVLVRERTRELEASREQHRLRALTDSLTQAWNRAAITDLISRQIAAAAGGQPFLVVLLDLDHFKRINDTHGHLAGDAVLKEFVARTRQNLRDADALGRYGGEEFLLLLPGLDAVTGHKRLSQLHLAVCAAPFPIEAGLSIAVTCSFGVTAGRAGASAEELIGQADVALYRAKEKGRNRIEYN